MIINECINEPICLLQPKDHQLEVLASAQQRKRDSEANIQTPDFENKFANSQISNTAHIQTVNQENKQTVNLPDLGLSSALGLFTPNISNQGEEQAPVKKKIPKKGIRR